MKATDKGIRRIFKAFVYSYDGFRAAFHSEAAFRQDLLVCIPLFIISFILPISFMERILMISSLFLILLMELANTAIEYVVDRISEEYHDLSKKAKDVGSLLVLLAFIHMLLVWGTILIQEVSK